MLPLNLIKCFIYLKNIKMNNIIKYISCLSLATILLVSCETKVDLNAEYKDIPVVYGIINPNDTTHYLKINKVFLPEDGVSAGSLAADASNLNYPAGDLSVTVQAINPSNQNVVATYNLTRTENEIPKDEGVFDNSVNVLYKFTEAAINRNYLYTLKIVNNKLNKEITSETLIVGNSTLTTPTQQQRMAFWIGEPSNGAYTDRTFTFVTGKNVGRVEAKLIFNYTNHFVASSGKPAENKKIVMNLGEIKTLSPVAGNETIEFALDGGTFFDNITSQTPATLPSLSHRELGNVSLEFVIAGTELNVYMEVTEPSNTVNQDKPNYTNVENGLGIFSSRETYYWFSSIDPNTGHINLTGPTIEKLHSLGLSFCFGNSATSNYQCPF